MSAAAAGLFLATPAGAATTTTCSAPALAQVYSWAQDTNWYAAIPAEKWDSLGSSGWTLSGGSKFVSTTLADGRKGTMLYMPSGSKAITPSVCVTNSYPAARTEIRNEKGTAGVTIYVAYKGSKSWGANLLSGTVTGVNTGWTLPLPFDIFPSSVSGWQVARFTLVANGTSSAYDISNFYVDPRMH